MADGKFLFPLHDADVKPDWAQLTRLGGDRVAILFEDLRERLSKISGLIIEELYFYGPSRGWEPRYRVGRRVLFAIAISPGSIGATVELAEPLLEKFLNSPKLTGKVKMWLRPLPIREGIALLRLRLLSSSDIGSLASLVAMIAREHV